MPLNGRLRSIRPAVGVTAAVSALALVVPAGAAGSAPDCTTTPGVCVVSFAYTGAPQLWVPTPGVTSARFTVDGGSGGANIDGVAGGVGGQVDETISVPVTVTVTVIVGGAGTTGPAGHVAAGGYPDGGTSGTVNGSGGGRSEVALGSLPELIAGGGGGAGTPAGDQNPNGEGGAGGAGGGADGRTLDGLPGAGTTPRVDGTVTLGPGGGGGGASGATPGLAGTAGTPSSGAAEVCPGLGGGDPLSGSSGSAGSATGAGANGLEQSGGGGGGYAGGGSGGTGAWDIICPFDLDGAGSGGGSSFAASGTPSLGAAPAGNGSVTVSYADPVQASDANYTVQADEATVVPVPSGLAGDASQPGGGAPSFSLTVGHGALHGSVAVNADGSFTYTPTTGFVGSDSFGYTAADSAGDSASATVRVTVSMVPTVTIASPGNGGVFALGQSVASSFSCAEGQSGPGLASCDDSNSTATTAGGSGHLDTSTLGAHTYTVKATSKDGLTATAAISYTVIAAPSVSIHTKQAQVTRGRVKITLTCSRSRACRGMLSLTIRQRAVRTVNHPRKVSMKTIVLAHAAYRLAAGRSRSVTLRLTPGAQRLLTNAAHHRLAVSASATVTGGRTALRAVVIR